VDFAAYHVAPPDTADVSDEDRARIVVLHPEVTHKRTNGDTEAIQEARRFLQTGARPSGCTRTCWSSWRPTRTTPPP
jgi:hypothetical protein